MQFSIKSGDPVAESTACAVLPVFADKQQPQITAAFDAASKGQITARITTGDISTARGSVSVLHEVAGTRAQRLVLIGCGTAEDFSVMHWARAIEAATRAVLKTTAADMISYLPLVAPADCDDYLAARLSVTASRAASYRYDELKSKPASRQSLKRVGLAVRGKGKAAMQRGVRHGIAIANGSDIARDLGNRPANVCTPSHIAATARRIARGNNRMAVKVLNEKDMKTLGMGALLSVTSGATEPAKLIVINYRGGKPGAAPVALCGKGVTFDTGGISLKPPAKMDEMKFDMCGAASVVGTMAAIAEMNLALNVVAVVPACENMPSGTATRPGDIVRSMSGQTIEILNTDAEGRPILCDALTYVQKQFKPAAVIDVATLTGACVIALGSVHAGVFANNASLRESLIAAGQRAADSAWPMPADEDYGEGLRSNFADFANIGGRDGGASVAAAFLHRFIERGTPWAHLDIAGVAWRADARKGATGRPVGLLVDYLISAA